MANGKHIPGGTDRRKNGHGPISVWRVTGAESFGFVIAEFASMATSLGVIAVADQLIPKKLLDTASKTLAKICIEPILDPFEKFRGAVCKLDECQFDPKQSREERAEAIARTILIFGAAYVASMKIKVHTRRVTNKHFGIVEELPKALAKDAPLLDKILHEVLFWRKWSKQECMIVAADEGFHIGSLLVLNNQLAPVTDDMIRTTTSMLQKVFGVSYEKAHQVATTAWVWEASNIIGAAAGIGAIFGKHKYGWPERHNPRSFVQRETSHLPNGYVVPQV